MTHFNTKDLIEFAEFITIADEYGSTWEIYDIDRQEEKNWVLKHDQQLTEYQWTVPDQQVELEGNGCCTVKVNEDPEGTFVLSFTREIEVTPEYMAEVIAEHAISQG